MTERIIIQVSDVTDNPPKLDPSTNELIRVYNLLDYDGMVNVLAAAYQERLRLNQAKQ